MKKSCMMMVGYMVLLAVSVGALAEGAAGRVTVYYNPSKTELYAPKLTEALKQATGKDTYENEGDYMGVFVDLPLKYEGFGVYAAYMTGSGDDIVGGNFTVPDYQWMNPYVSSHANPTTGEKMSTLSTFGTYTIWGMKDESMRANIDVMIGYSLLDSRPDTSLANVYSGVAYGLKAGCGKTLGPSEVGLDLAVSYLPTYKVAGNVEASLADDNILQYRAGLECAFLGSYAATVGYQGMRLEAVSKAGGPNAVVQLTGMYVGASVRF